MKVRVRLTPGLLSQLYFYLSWSTIIYMLRTLQSTLCLWNSSWVARTKPPPSVLPGCSARTSNSTCTQLTSSTPSSAEFLPQPALFMVSLTVCPTRNLWVTQSLSPHSFCEILLKPTSVLVSSSLTESDLPYSALTTATTSSLPVSTSHPCSVQTPAQAAALYRSLSHADPSQGASPSLSMSSPDTCQAA